MANLAHDVERLAAIAEAGSRAFATHSGATLTRMSDLAKNGELEEFGRSAVDHIKIHLTDRIRVISSVPATILNEYMYVFRGNSIAAVERWRGKNPGWAERLERAVLDPAGFVRVVEAMAADIAREVKA